ncbi:NAD(P)-binding protein [Sporormia fimetaria CBS 119925]|uniref:NAD(P)-binding protein n=1 Tax=Sporormia fimetaria CBS 119925 TaxID=1340428 RepID=A0A6A6VR96_9PLEO|nr:NAD(P)-binding protein [Sporormia fimetaria CBS 119925]
MPHPRTILITGASSGLGHAFLTHYSSLSPQPTIHALDIHIPAQSTSRFSTVTFWKVDITSTSELQDLSAKLQEQGTKVDLLIHCAGIRGLVPNVREAEESRDTKPAETWEVMDHATFMKTVEVNTWGTFNVLKCLIPLLKFTPTTDESHEEPEARPKAIVLSSRMGSMTAYTEGGGYAYRASKAALNAVVRGFVVDVPEVTFLLLHPRKVETGLVPWREEGARRIEDVIGDCLETIEKADSSWSGRFVDPWGNDIAW